MDSAADHEFNPRSASTALKKAMQALSEKTGRTEAELTGIRLGDAYDMAVEAFGDELPEFWTIWNGWNTAPDEAAPWGDL
jgi:hypothetical protein